MNGTGSRLTRRKIVLRSELTHRQRITRASRFGIETNHPPGSFRQRRMLGVECSLLGGSDSLPAIVAPHVRLSCAGRERVKRGLTAFRGLSGTTGVQPVERSGVSCVRRQGTSTSMAATELALTRIPEVKVEMLVRRPPEKVFQALVDPDITTKFWFTNSSGKIQPGAQLEWEWEMYGVSGGVHVVEVDENRRILFTWDGEQGMSVEFVFTPWGDEATHVEIIESGFEGDGDRAVTWVADSTGGFTIMLCALKALLEYDVELNAVRDAHPLQLQH